MSQYVSPWVGLVREAMVLAVCAVLVVHGAIPSEFLTGVFGMILGSRATARGYQQGASMSPPPPPPSMPANDQAPRMPPPPRMPMGTQPRTIAVLVFGVLLFAVVAKGITLLRVPPAASLCGIALAAVAAVALLEREIRAVHGVVLPRGRARGFVAGEAVALAVVLGGCLVLVRCKPAAVAPVENLATCVAREAQAGAPLLVVVEDCAPQAIDAVIAELLASKDPAVTASRAWREAKAKASLRDGGAP